MHVLPVQVGLLYRTKEKAAGQKNSSLESSRRINDKSVNEIALFLLLNENEYALKVLTANVSGITSDDHFRVAVPRYLRAENLAS
jgi:hypothetical protein